MTELNIVARFMAASDVLVQACMDG